MVLHQLKHDAAVPAPPKFLYTELNSEPSLSAHLPIPITVKPPGGGGTTVGLSVGHLDGSLLGLEVGFFERVGLFVGLEVGFFEGLSEGLVDVCLEGEVDGFLLGLSEGLEDGFFEGVSVGLDESFLEGVCVGLPVGLAVGFLDGSLLGLEVGFFEGLSEGLAVGDDVVSQLSPKKPAGQVHVRPQRSSMQVPPFRQGFEVQ